MKGFIIKWIECTTFSGKSNRRWHLLHLNWIRWVVSTLPQFQHLLKCVPVLLKYLSLGCLLHFIAFGLEFAFMHNFWPNVIVLLRLCSMFSFSLVFYFQTFSIGSEYHNNVNTLFIQQFNIWLRRIRNISFFQTISF